MLFKVDSGGSEPLHEQITFQIRRAITKGELEPSDRLPAARQLAESLDVNMHTVSAHTERFEMKEFSRCDAVEG